VKPARQYQPQGSVTVCLLAFWHPQPAATHVERCDEQVGTRAPGSEPGRQGASRSTLAKSSTRSDSSWGAPEQLAAWLWCLRLRAQWSSTRVREIWRNRAQEKNTPMRCETAVAILASEGLALVSVSRHY